MSNHNDDLADLDPTDADLLAPVEDDEPTVTVDEDDFDFDSNYEDDRYSTGIPPWSAFA